MLGLFFRDTFGRVSKKDKGIIAGKGRFFWISVFMGEFDFAGGTSFGDLFSLSST